MSNDGEFLWLVSLSDLMILLFVFFVVLFGLSYKKMDPRDFRAVASQLSGTKTDQGTRLDEIQKKILKWVVDRKLLDSVSVTQKEDAIILEIKEKLLFNSGDWQIKPESQDVLDGVVRALELIPPPYRIGIEGHTDDVPVRARPDGKGLIQDNWELSTERALSVFKALDLSPETRARTVVMGYGPSRPLAPNEDEQGKPLAKNRLLNRRVSIRIY